MAQIIASMDGDLQAFLASQPPAIAKQIAAYFDDDKDTPVDEVLRGIDFAGWASLVGKMQPYIEASLKEGGGSALIQIGQSNAEDAFYVVNQNAADFAEARAAEMVGMKYVDGDLVANPDAKWAITDGTREMIRSTVTEAQQNGWSNEQIASALKDNYAFSDARAMMIARTETARADIAGMIAGWKASGVVASKQWIVGEECCDECEEMDGEVVGLHDEFSDGSDGPPLHPNCRCSLLGLVDEGPAQDDSSDSQESED